MFRLFASLLLALTLALSPLAMNGGMGMAHAGDEMTAGHCSETKMPAEQGDQAADTLDCMSICSAVTAGQQDMLARPALPQIAEAFAPAFLSGIPPEGETPPPRMRPAI